MSCSAVRCLWTVLAIRPNASRVPRRVYTCTRESRLRSGDGVDDSGNNLPSLDVPPTYTADWGFSDGAQNDIFTKSSNPAGDQGLINPYATGTGTVSYSYVCSQCFA